MRLYTLGFLDDLVRALDYLSAQPGVDPTRLGYVGHSLGAAIAGAFLARDARVHAAVLMTPTGRISQFWVTDGDPNRAQLEVFDGVANLPTTTVPMLFQFAEEDEWITRADAEAQVTAAAGPKTARWYDTDHALNGEALVERAAWLTTTLSFPSIPVVSTDNLLTNAQVRSYRVSKPFLHLRNWIASRRG
jgi:dienelactone hydrolase